MRNCPSSATYKADAVKPGPCSGSGAVGRFSAGHGFRVLVLAPLIVIIRNNTHRC